VALDRLPDALKVIARRLYLGPVDHAAFARALLSSTKDAPQVFIARVNAELPKYPSLAPLVAAMEAQRLS